MSASGIYDCVVIGAGIAGASVAYELSQDASVLLLEMESAPGYHTTGRSAAVLAPSYGPAPIRALTRASVPFFESPPEGFCDDPLVSPHEVIMLARKDQMGSLERFFEGAGSEADLTRLNAGELRARHPLLRQGYGEAGALDPSTHVMDVDLLHRGFLRGFKARGGSLAVGSEVTSLSRSNGVWDVQAGEVFRGSVVVNASGAWADHVGALAGAERIGLVPKRRTALIVEGPWGVDVARLPMIVDIDEQFYMKPEAGKLLISPANEDPVEPHDVQPEEMDVALCVDRITRAFDLEVRRIEHSWAGLRSFVADKSPVVGYSELVEGFFWLAGQGGYGIQSAPGLSRLGAALARGEDVPEDLVAEGVRVEDLAVGRG